MQSGKMEREGWKKQGFAASGPGIDPEASNTKQSAVSGNQSRSVASVRLALPIHLQAQSKSLKDSPASAAFF